MPEPELPQIADSSRDTKIKKLTGQTIARSNQLALNHVLRAGHGKAAFKPCGSVTLFLDTPSGR